MSQASPPVNTPPGRRGPQTETNHRELRRQRIRAGLTLEELAGLAQPCSKNHLSQVENDKVNASQPLLRRLANALGCDITDLLADEPANGNGPERAA